MSHTPRHMNYTVRCSYWFYVTQQSPSIEPPVTRFTSTGIGNNSAPLKAATSAMQQDFEPQDMSLDQHELMMKKRSFKRSEPTRGEPCTKIARNAAEDQAADIPLSPDGMLRCRVRTWQDRKYADLRQFCKDGEHLVPTTTGIMLDPVEWEHLADALPELQAALGALNTNFQVNMSQMRSASVCCDQEGPFVDVREFSWNLNSNRNFGRGNREPTDQGIELGKSSLRALSHAAAIISSLLPGCTKPPSPPKSARVYRPGLDEASYSPVDPGCFPPTACASLSNIDASLDAMHTDEDTCGAHLNSFGYLYPENILTQYNQTEHCGYGQNPGGAESCGRLTQHNSGVGSRDASMMHAAHTAYRLAELSPSILGAPPAPGFGGQGAHEGHSMQSQASENTDDAKP